jgi:chromosomal replication initiation ATPase DnaA
LQEAAAAGHWETGWKAQIKYTVLLGSVEFVDRMRKLLRGDRDQQTGVRRGAVERLPWPQIVSAVSEVWNRPWQELLSARGSGAREAALFIGRTRARLRLKELGQLAGGIHHNAVSIAIRRFTARLNSDHTLRRKLSLVEKALEASQSSTAV